MIESSNHYSESISLFCLQVLSGYHLSSKGCMMNVSTLSPSHLVTCTQARVEVLEDGTILPGSVRPSLQLLTTP